MQPPPWREHQEVELVRSDQLIMGGDDSDERECPIGAKCGSTIFF